MGTLHRIKFHTRMAIKGVASRLKETMHPQTDEEILAEFEERAESVTPEEKEEIKRTFQEHEDNEPVLDPEKTMLIQSRPEEHGCNAFTVGSYRDKLFIAIEFARKNGIDTFLADYSTPFGLLALEELVKLREAGENFRVYAVKSNYITQRRTYRIIRETPIEMAFLPVRADYTYHELPEYMLRFVLPMAGVQCSERGFWYSSEKLPPEKQMMWGKQIKQ